MNRRKKVNQGLRARIKKANAKLNPSAKPKYVSKADRAKLAAEEGSEDSASKAAGPAQTPSQQ